MFSQHVQAAGKPAVPCFKQSLGVAWLCPTLVQHCGSLGLYLLPTQKVLGSLGLQLSSSVFSGIPVPLEY